MSFTARLDRAEEERYLRKFSGSAVDHILGEAAKVGAKAAAQVMRSAAPVGTAQRLSQYYRRMGLSHGTFRKSVRAALIRGRGSAINLQGRTIGYVIGPIGKNAFTRAWIEQGTSHARANPWVEQAASPALTVAREASESVLEVYSRG